jgi:drug/metabolite transporter (DMT)-like permease
VAVLLGVLVAIAFGTGDFIGGRASTRASTVAVLVVSHSLGVVGALVLALLVSAQIELHDVLFGALAGAATVVGLGLLYQGLATNAMGVVAPITAVVGAIVPITYGVVRGERPSVFTAIGIALAVGAGALIAREQPDADQPRNGRLAPGIAIAIAAGLALGSSLVLFSETSQDSGMYPVLFGRTAGLIVALIGAAWLFARSEITFPRGQAFGFALGAGALDVLATALLLLAVRRGLISVVAGLAALAPGFTVLWAFVVLHEDLRRDQRVAILVALVGLVLVAAG